MNENIKFRVWDNKYKCWMQGDLNVADKYGISNFISKGGKGYSLHRIIQNETLSEEGEIEYNGTNPRFVVQQCTGLKDKNGVYIYDGDIVKVDRWNLIPFVKDQSVDYKWNELGTCIGVVMWWNLGGNFFVSYEHIRYDDTDDKISGGYRTEIIGNIFENSNILNKNEY